MASQLIAEMLDLPASSHCTIALFEIRLQRVQLQIFRNQKAPVIPHTLDLFLEGVVESFHLLHRAEIVQGGRTILPRKGIGRVRGYSMGQQLQRSAC